MATKTLVATTGAIPWATAGSWSPSGVPATGDTVIITSGDASCVITAASTQAAVLLAQFIAYDTFLGKFNVDVAGTDWKIGLQSGATQGNSGSPQFIITNGTNPFTGTVYKTGASTDALLGLGAVRFSGTATTNSVTAFSGSVDVGNDLTVATKCASLYITGQARVTVGRLATTTAITVTGGSLIHNGLADPSASSLTQTNGTVTTTGATKFVTTVLSGGTLNYAHRASSGDSVVTFDGYGGTIDITGSSAALGVTTRFYLGIGCTLKCNGLSQVTTTPVAIAPGSITPS